MSHFIVVLKISNKVVQESSVEEAVKTMLAPYQENNMGDCPDQYLAFNDVEAEYLQKYEVDTTTMVNIDGKLIFAYDNQFKVRRTDFFAKDEWVYPDGVTPQEVPVKVEYPTFEQYVEDYCGHMKDPKTGKYGYWENPNAKWDWYSIGGRWSGFFPAKDHIEASPANIGRPGVFDNKPEEGHVDIVQHKDIDFDRIDKETVLKANKFWNQWQRFKAGEKFDPWDGPRSKALDIGLLKVVNSEAELQEGEKERAISWEKYSLPGDKRAAWFDVFTECTYEQFIGKYLNAFYKIGSYSYLDDKGWHSPGEMGWWGTSSEKPEDLLPYNAKQIEWFETASEDDWFVAVDCHI